MIPKVIFKEMSIEENIEIIKWAYFENNDTLEVNSYTLEYFPELKDISKNTSEDEIYQKIEEVVTKKYQEYKDTIQKEVKRYNSIWSNINDKYMGAISKYLNVDYIETKEIVAKVGFLPIFPRDLDELSFSVGTNLDEDSLIETVAHEVLHFFWFKKFKELFPLIPRKEYDSPYLAWVYSEIIADPILNSKEIKDIIKVNSKAYDSFYELEDGMVIATLREIYQEDISIEEKIEKGYYYLKENVYKNKKYRILYSL